MNLYACFRPLIGVIISNSKFGHEIDYDDFKSFRPLIGVIISNCIDEGGAGGYEYLFPSPYRGYHF